MFKAHPTDTLDVNGDGSVTQADYDLVYDHFGQTCPTIGQPNKLTSAQFTRADINGDCALNSTDLAIVNTYLNQSNAQPLVQYNWDAENRLVSAGPPSAFPLGSGSPDPNDVVSEYRYDYLGRRVEKRVKIWSTSGTPAWVVQQRRFFIYNGWTMLLELDARDLTGGAGGTPDGNPDNVILRKHTWGLDLAGQSGSLNSLQAVGGTLFSYGCGEERYCACEGTWGCRESSNRGDLRIHSSVGEAVRRSIWEYRYSHRAAFGFWQATARGCRHRADDRGGGGQNRARGRGATANPRARRS